MINRNISILVVMMSFFSTQLYAEVEPNVSLTRIYAQCLEITKEDVLAEAVRAKRNTTKAFRLLIDCNTSGVFLITLRFSETGGVITSYHVRRKFKSKTDMYPQLDASDGAFTKRLTAKQFTNLLLLIEGSDFFKRPATIPINEKDARDGGTVFLIEGIDAAASNVITRDDFFTLPFQNHASDASVNESNLASAVFYIAGLLNLDVTMF